MQVQINTQQDWETGEVLVLIGDTEIGRLAPVTTSQATHGDDSTYYESEERRVIEETVAQWFLTEVLGKTKGEA